MIRQEAAFAPTATVQTITTDETEFANAFYQVASQSGLEVEIEVLGGVHQLTFMCSDNDLICSLYWAAHNLAEAWLWREMPGVEEAIQTLLSHTRAA